MVRDPEIQELLDRARIADTIYAYCDYVDRADIDGVLGLFTEDGLMDLGGGAIHRGRAELRDMFLDRFALYSTTCFQCSAIRLVRYDGATAFTTTYLNAFHESESLGRQMHLWGRYEDEMVNQSGTWRFRKRVLRVAGLSHNSSHEVPQRFSRIGHDPMPPQQHPDSKPLPVDHLTGQSPGPEPEDGPDNVLRGPDHWSRMKR